MPAPSPSSDGRRARDVGSSSFVRRVGATAAVALVAQSAGVGLAAQDEAAPEVDRGLLRTRCEVVHPIPDQSILYGYIIDAASGLPLPGGTVHLRWVERRGVADSTIYRAEAESPDGAYVFCDVPQGVRINAWADAAGQSGKVTDVFFRGGETERRDIQVGFDRQTGSIYGLLEDADTGRPIEGATITIPTSDVSALSDRNGRFVIDELTAGTYELTVAHLAYGTPGLTVVVEPGGNTHADIRLEPRAIALEPISVAVKMRPQWLETKGFYERMERGLGQFVAPEDIAMSPMRRFSEILQTVQGVDLEGTACSPRCDPDVRMKITTTSRDSCRPEVYVDGNRLIGPAGGGSGWDLDVFAHPSDLAAIEIYRGISETPVEFYGRCGSIVIWTRRGG